MPLFDERGATPIEYALISALIAVVIIASLTFLSSNIANKFEVIAATVKVDNVNTATSIKFPLTTRTASVTPTVQATPNFLVTRTASLVPIFFPTATRTIETPAGGSNEEPTATCDPVAGRC